MEDIKNYIEQNKTKILEELFGLIRIPSISSEAAHKDDMIKAAEYWKEILLKAGADKAEIFSTAGNPVVYGEKIIDPVKPTVLVYAHYDVMPVDPAGIMAIPLLLSHKYVKERYLPVEQTMIKDSLSCRPKRLNTWSNPELCPAMSNS